MAYSNTIPAASDRIKDSQSALLANFQAIQTFIEVNHETFGSANEGEHKFVTFPVQSPAPSFGAAKNGMYTLLNGTTSKNELYVHKQTFAGTSDIPFTASILSTATPALAADGWTYLPSGLYIRFGSGNANGLTTVTMSPAPPTQLLTVVVTPYSSTTSYQDSTVRLVEITSNTQFKVYGAVNGAAGAIGFTYIAIGY